MQIINIERFLLKNENKLKVNWHPGCFYDKDKGKYITGPIGSTGPVSNEEAVKPKPKPTQITEIPKALSIYVSTEDTDENIHSELFSLFEELKTDNSIEVICNKYFTIQSKIPKSEYREIVNEIEARNKIILDKVAILSKQLEELGCDIDEMSGPDIEIIPNEYYDISLNQHSTIIINCHSETDFYQMMLKNGILERAFPEWFRNCNF